MSATQSASIKKTDAATQRRIIRQYVQENPRSSRTDIADGTGLRLSSVCGRVNELLKSGDIFVSGTKLDTATNREVEVLSPLVVVKTSYPTSWQGIA